MSIEKRKHVNLNDFCCPVCKKYFFSEPSFEICPICGWEDDPVQRNNPDFKGGANKLSLNEAIEMYYKNKNAV